MDNLIYFDYFTKEEGRIFCIAYEPNQDEIELKKQINDHLGTEYYSLFMEVHKIEELRKSLQQTDMFEIKEQEKMCLRSIHDVLPDFYDFLKNKENNNKIYEKSFLVVRKFVN